MLQFATNERARPDPPPGIWGIVIDGSRRRHFFLTESTYSLRAVDGGISVIARDAKDAIFRIRKSERGIEVLDPLDTWSARVAVRHSERNYESFGLESDHWFDSINFPFELTQSASLGADPAAIVFQVVAVQSRPRILKDRLSLGATWHEIPRDHGKYVGAEQHHSKTLA